MSWYLSSATGPKERMKNICQRLKPVFYYLFVLGQVLFALSCRGGAGGYPPLPLLPSPVRYGLCTTTVKPCHWFISAEIKVTLMCIVQSHSSWWLRRSSCHFFLPPCVLSIGGSDIYLSAFHSLGSIALNIFVCVVNSVSKCPH